MPIFGYLIYTPLLMGDSAATLSQQAISAALSSNWEGALTLNQEILELDPTNIEALNRLGRAYFELGNLTKSKKYFDSALENDPYNQIAAKFLKRIKAFDKKGGRAAQLKNHCNSLQVDSDLFIEEPGKTKVVTLLKVAEPQKLSLLSAGAPVNLNIKNHGVTVTDQSGSYLGIFPDDLSHRLTRLMNGGNKYQAVIKTIKTNSLSILIREVFRAAKFRNQASFLDGLNGTLITYASDALLLADEDEEELPPEGEEEETI